MDQEKLNEFYKNNQKIYSINSPVFNSWYSEFLKADEWYRPQIKKDDIDNMINFFNDIYGGAFSDRLFLDNNKEEIEKKGNYLNHIKESRLPLEEKSILDCLYRKSEWTANHKYNRFNMGLVSISPYATEYDVVLNINILIGTNVLKDSLQIKIRQNGILKPYNLDRLEEYIGKIEGEVSIEEIYEKLKRVVTHEIDYHEVEECVKTHQKDLEFRDKIIEMIMHSMIYSVKTYPVYGQIRAHYFLKDLKQLYGNTINTNIKPIDDLVNPFITEKTHIK